MSDINVAASIDVGKNTQELIEKLAVQIGVTVDKVWPWLVRQQVLEGWTILAAILIALVIGVVLLGVALVLDKKETEICIPFFMVGGLLCVFAIFALFMAGPDQIQKIYNPEYSALKDLIGMVKP